MYVPLAIIVCDKLEWERKMEEQDIHVDMNGTNILLKLVSLCGTQSGKQSCKRKLRARYSWLTWRLQYLSRLVWLMIRFVWQVKDMRMRHDMLLHSLKLERVVVWDEYCCTREASKRKVNETWVNAYMMSQIGKLAYEIKWWIYIDKEDFMHNTNQCEFQNRRLG